ncbi:hypothetical protein L1987_51779 [Smallanthus sonchifolius]|uniref:Uncharacterized protein n=1 Tax=Smallanthus sonchifolius TaxID=185202 RepID=A0ACB9ERK2_9ASTR|nr:hypothetical protein L1987_51779 [Smallanthus sonchifolius]
MQDDNSSDEGSDIIDWNTDYELEIANTSSPSSVTITTTNSAVTTDFGEIVNDFMKMGFPEAMVTKFLRELDFKKELRSLNKAPQLHILELADVLIEQSHNMQG